MSMDPARIRFVNNVYKKGSHIHHLAFHMEIMDDSNTWVQIQHVNIDVDTGEQISDEALLGIVRG